MATKKTTAAGPVKLLSADDILNADDLATIDVPVPEWGGVVRLRTWNADEAIQFSESQQGQSKRNAAVRAVLMSAIDENGVLLFDLKQLEALKKKNIKAFLRLAAAALRLNGLDGSLEEELKNVSSETGSGDSPTGSH